VHHPSTLVHWWVLVHWGPITVMICNQTGFKNYIIVVLPIQDHKVNKLSSNCLEVDQNSKKLWLTWVCLPQVTPPFLYGVFLCNGLSHFFQNFKKIKFRRSRMIWASISTVKPFQGC
jgi:hypothetical protein